MSDYRFFWQLLSDNFPVVALQIFSVIFVRPQLTSPHGAATGLRACRRNAENSMCIMELKTLEIPRIRRIAKRKLLEIPGPEMATEKHTERLARGDVALPLHSGRGRASNWGRRDLAKFPVIPWKFIPPKLISGNHVTDFSGNLGSSKTDPVRF